jgi:hypothetical protein
MLLDVLQVEEKRLEIVRLKRVADIEDAAV